MKKIVINVAVFCSILIASVSHSDCACDRENDPGTPINQAILSIMDVRDNALALKLLDEGMDPDTTNACGAGLLLMSAYYNDIYLTQELLSKGASPNIKNFSGETPVFAAAQISRNKILEMLLIAGGDPNPESPPCLDKGYYNTPLLTAAANSNLDGVKLLLEHGADFTVASPKGATFFNVLLARGNSLEEILELIDPMPEKNKIQAHSELLFEIARREDMLSELNYLLSMPLNPNYSVDDDTPYNTPLLIAALAGNIDGVKALIDHGADIHYTNSEGYSLERIINENDIEELYYLFPSSEE